MSTSSLPLGYLLVGHIVATSVPCHWHVSGTHKLDLPPVCHVSFAILQWWIDVHLRAPKSRASSDHLEYACSLTLCHFAKLNRWASPFHEIMSAVGSLETCSIFSSRFFTWDFRYFVGFNRQASLACESMPTIDLDGTWSLVKSSILCKTHLPRDPCMCGSTWSLLDLLGCLQKNVQACGVRLGIQPTPYVKSLQGFDTMVAWSLGFKY